MILKTAFLFVGVAMAAMVAPIDSPSVPVVVELFTSEGCSSCPPADALLQRLVETQPVAGAKIIGLGMHVDYWDKLGWRDRFSSAALTARQRAYAERFNTDTVYTPQMIVDGRTEFVGSDAVQARRAIERDLTARHGVVRLTAQLTDDPARVAVEVEISQLPPLDSSHRGDHADILVAITENQLRSDVKRGENHGRILTHTAVVRELITIGEATLNTSVARAEIPVAADWQRDRLTIAAIVQARRDRTILAAAAEPLTRR